VLGKEGGRVKLKCVKCGQEYNRYYVRLRGVQYLSRLCFGCARREGLGLLRAPAKPADIRTALRLLKHKLAWWRRMYT